MACTAWQGELAEKDKELAAAGVEIEKLLQKIGDNTAVAEKEKAKVAVIVAQVTQQAQVGDLHLSSWSKLLLVLAPFLPNISLALKRTTLIILVPMK